MKDASKQVKYRLDHLDRKGKKIICNLFIERIEMYRKPVVVNGKEQWKVWPEIFFRFNPDKFPKAAQVGRSTTSQKKAKKQSSESKNDVDGAPAET